MARYSLASGLFFLDAESAARHDVAAALESIAAAGFSETELMAEGDEWQNRAHTTQDRVVRRWSDLGSFHTPYTHLCRV